MKKLLLLFFAFFVGFINVNAQEYTDIEVKQIFVDGKESESIPKKEDGYIFEKTKCTNNVSGTWDSDSWSLKLSNVTSSFSCKIYFITDNGGASNNPNTGAFISYPVIIILSFGALFLIVKTLKNRKFYKI